MDKHTHRIGWQRHQEKIDVALEILSKFGLTTQNILEVSTGTKRRSQRNFFKLCCERKILKKIVIPHKQLTIYIPDKNGLAIIYHDFPFHIKLQTNPSKIPEYVINHRLLMQHAMLAECKNNEAYETDLEIQNTKPFKPDLLINERKVIEVELSRKHGPLLYEKWYKLLLAYKEGQIDEVIYYSNTKTMDEYLKDKFYRVNWPCIKNGKATAEVRPVKKELKKIFQFKRFPEGIKI